MNARGDEFLFLLRFARFVQTMDDHSEKMSFHREGSTIIRRSLAETQGSGEQECDIPVKGILWGNVCRATQSGRTFHHRPGPDRMASIAILNAWETIHK
jgi:hypothetical protein